MRWSLGIGLNGLVAAGVMLDDSQIHDLRVVNSGEIMTGGKIVVSVWGGIPQGPPGRVRGA